MAVEADAGTIRSSPTATVPWSVEANHYSRADVDTSVLEKSVTTTVCPWKGTAHYYTIETRWRAARADAAWYYPDPKPEAEQIRDRIAFWKGVEVVEA